MKDGDDQAGTAPEPQGRLAGLPYDFRRLTASRVRSRAWNPGDPRVFTPKAFGWGLGINWYWLVHPVRLMNARRRSQVTDRIQVSRWLAGYESAWRAPGTGALAGLFTSDASYLQSPYQQPVVGLAAIERMWDEERESPGEIFTLATEILAVDGATAVVRAEVHYGDPPRQEYRDLWVIHLGDDGRCTWFEEWPFWPGHPYAARDDHA